MSTALCVWAWMDLLSQLLGGLWLCLPSCAALCVSLSTTSSLGDLAPFIVFLWRVWPLWLLPAYVCLCLRAVFTGVSGLGHDVPITQVGGAPSPLFLRYPLTPHLPSHQGPVPCGAGLGLLRGEGLRGPAGLSRPEQVGLLICLTAASPAAASPQPPPPRTRTRVWARAEGVCAVAGSWPCFPSLYLTAE